MRSIAHSEQEKANNKIAVVSVSGTDEIADKAISVPDPSMSAEERMVQADESREVQQAILALFADDEIAEVIVEGMMDGLEGEELRELCGLDERAYASKRRLIRRRIDKSVSEGMEAMTRKKIYAQGPLDRLADALVDDILCTSDEDILAELKEDGGDAERMAAEMRSRFEQSVIIANKSRLKAAQAGLGPDS